MRTRTRTWAMLGSLLPHLGACGLSLDLDNYGFAARADGGAPAPGDTDGASGAGGGQSSAGGSGASGAAGAGGTAPSGAAELVFDDYRFERGQASYSVDAAAGLLSNDRAVGSVTVGTFDTQRGGRVTLAADGSFTYSPPSAAFWGDDGFEYELADRRGAVRVSVQPGALTLADVAAGEGNGFAIEGGLASDFAGASVAGVGDVNDDGLADVLVGAYGADPGGNASAGAAYVVLGKRDGTVRSLAALTAGQGFVLNGVAANDFAGNAVASAGDVNADGLPDLLVGAYRAASAVGDNAGAAYLVFGKREGVPVSLAELSAVGFAMSGVDGGDFAGNSVAGAGDVNGDGLADVIVGAFGAAPSGITGAGTAHVVFGKRDTVAVSLAAVRAGGGGFAINGSDASDAAGFAVAGAGDVNADGFADVIVGAPGADASSSAAYVVFGKPDGAAVSLAAIDSGQGGFAITPDASGGALGRAVGGAGDVNGDGFADLVVGAVGAYVVFGKAGTASVSLARVELDQTGFAMRDELVSNSVAGASDVNGDGLDDVIVGVPDAIPGVAGRGYGKTCVVFGTASSQPVVLEELAASAGFCVGGVANEDYSGQSVAGAGDVNADGLADVITGAYQADPGGNGAAGAAYVLFGWNATGALGTRHGALLGGAGNDTLDYARSDLVSIAGGGGTDTLRVAGSGMTLDLTLRTPRVSSIEAIDLTGNGAGTLVLGDRALLELPDTRAGLPGGLVKALVVSGDSDDGVRVDLSDYQLLVETAERRVYGKLGAAYGLELSASLTVTAP